MIVRCNLLGCGAALDIPAGAIAEHPGHCPSHTALVVPIYLRGVGRTTVTLLREARA